MVRATTDDEQYRRLKEAFVSDHYGSSVWDINKVLFIAPITVLLWSILQVRRRFFDPYTPQAYLADFLLNGAAILFAVTVYSENALVLDGLILLPTIFFFAHTKSPEPRKIPKKPSTDKDDDPADLEVIATLPVKPFITHYRGAMIVITCICILAVDFKVFPRRFAKTESLGTSVMDLGVGSFVFSAGLVSVRQQLLEMYGDAKKVSFIKRFANSFRHALPLLALGLLRLYMVKKLNYVEHVTEYGLHWNFFFTLAVIPPFVALCHPLFRLIPNYALIGFLATFIQQMFIAWTDLLYWLAFAPRDDLISANKEGLISIPGYLAIFLIGQAVGMSILPRDQDPEAAETENDLWLADTLGGADKVTEMKETHRQFAWLNLAKYSGASIVMYVFLVGKYGPRMAVSRRFANMPYVFWVAAFNCVQLWVFCTIESLFFGDIYLARHKKVEMEKVKKATSRLLAAFNRNALAIFLLANVLTGLINLSLRTIEMEDLTSVAVLVGYLATLSAVALGLDHYNISIKL